MIIHVIREGESLYHIGNQYGVDYKKIAKDNDISIDQQLVIGQTLVIITDEDEKKFRQIEVNGYAYPNIDDDIFRNTLPYLTYLSIFSYQINSDGSLRSIEDEELIDTAKKYKVVPIMVITNIGSEDRFSSELAHIILNSEELQNKVINNILRIMRKKGYSGLTIDFEYIYSSDKESFIKFISKIKSEMERYNYLLIVAVAPKTSDEQQGILYEAHDYKRIGVLADRVVIMTYEWGYAGGPAMAVAPLDSVIKVLDYAVTRISSRKILMGLPNYGYDWTLPFEEGNIAKSISFNEAVDIARTHKQAIEYNYEDQTPYFYYYDSNNTKHEVWFDDARSIQVKLELVIKYNLGGVSFWTINRYSNQSYLILSQLFNIKKY